MKNNNQHYKTSHILKEIAEYPTDSGTISIRQFMQMLGDRGFCLAILIFSLPNSLPVPGIPGFSTITGIPIIFIGLQMMLGKKALWLPKSIADRRFSKIFISKVLLKSLPYVIRLEKILRPRLLFMTSAWGERVLGFFFVVLAVIIAMPIPGGNLLPGLSISLLALGMLERDGLFLLVAMVFILGSITIMIEIIAAGFKWIASFF